MSPSLFSLWHSVSARSSKAPFKSQAFCAWMCCDLVILLSLCSEPCFPSPELCLLKVRLRLYKLLVPYFPPLFLLYILFIPNTKASPSLPKPFHEFQFSLFLLLIPLIVFSEFYGNRRKNAFILPTCSVCLTVCFSRFAFLI